MKKCFPIIEQLLVEETKVVDYWRESGISQNKKRKEKKMKEIVTL